MSEKKRSRGRPSGTSRRTTMVSRRLDAELWEAFQAYVRGLQPRSSDTAVLEMLLRDFLTRADGHR